MAMAQSINSEVTNTSVGRYFFSVNGAAARAGEEARGVAAAGMSRWKK
jgi:hypothetical protein